MLASRFTLLVVLTIGVGLAHAQAEVLSEYRAEYKVGSENINAGLVKNSLKEEGGNWRYESKTDPSGLVSLHGAATATATSVLELHDGKLRQLKFTYRDKDKKKERHSDADFDWQSNHVTIRYGERNVIAIRVYDAGGHGGIYAGPIEPVE